MGKLITSLFAASDEQTMWRVRTQADPQAFARLVNRWERPIQRLCARMTGDAHRAEDLAQEVFVRVFAKRETWEPSGKFSTFLWRIALNLCHDELRKTKRRGERPLEEFAETDDGEAERFASDSPSPDELANANERGELVRQAMLKLPPIYREVVSLRHYEQLKFHEIGEVLGIPEGTVKSRMAEALTQLGGFLKHLNENASCKQKSQTPELQVL